MLGGPVRLGLVPTHRASPFKENYQILFRHTKTIENEILHTHVLGITVSGGIQISLPCS
jgi:hypothetical protein